MMKLTVQQVFDATQTLATIISENRPLPQKGRYRVARMHAKLLPEFTVANDQRTAKIMAYENTNEAGQPAVPDAEMPGFIAWWNEMASETIEVNIDPIPIDQLCIDGQEASISFAEFAVLADLVSGE